MLGVDIRKSSNCVASFVLQWPDYVTFRDSGPHYSRLLPPLLEKLGDSKIVLRQIVIRVLMQLMQV
jgi:hypothetical protein